MVPRVCFLTVCLAACVAAQEEVAPTIPQLTKDGDAFYLKGDYEAARLAFTRAWDLAQETPKDNPVRYDILKRLTSVRAAAGEFADADNWLQQAITWRENTLGWKDPKIADDLLISVGLCRGMKDFDRALAILRRVQGHTWRRTRSTARRWRTISAASGASTASRRRSTAPSIRSTRRWPSAPNWGVRSTPR